MRTGASLIGIRIITVIVLPIALVVTFFHRLAEEMRSAVWFAWNEACQEWSAAKRVWRGGEPYKD